jgi:hypothetical protein
MMAVYGLKIITRRGGGGGPAAAAAAAADPLVRGNVRLGEKRAAAGAAGEPPPDGSAHSAARRPGPGPGAGQGRGAPRRLFHLGLRRPRYRRRRPPDLPARRHPPRRPPRRPRRRQPAAARRRRRPLRCLRHFEPAAAPRLRAAAAAAGVAPDRLWLTAPLGGPARAQLRAKGAAHLFLDTWAYGAHGTAADALWARLPVVTRPGAHLAARVAASLLLRGGGGGALAALVARGAEDYVRVAARLAGLVRAAIRRPGRPPHPVLARVLAALAAAVDEGGPAVPAGGATGPFDTAAWVQGWERGLRLLAEARLAAAATWADPGRGGEGVGGAARYLAATARHHIVPCSGCG